MKRVWELELAMVGRMNKLLKLAIILGWLMLSIAALTQTTSNGNVVSVGQVITGGGGGGAPLTYGARTDLCVTGLEPGCSGLGLSFQMRTVAFGGVQDVPPFANLVPMGAGATDPDFHSYMVMVTDQTIKNPTNQWEVNNGDQAMINLNSTMLLVKQVGGGGFYVMLMDPVAIHAQSSTGANPCVGCIAKSSIVQGVLEPSCGASCTKIPLGSSIVWSLTPGEPNVMYELMIDNVTVNKLTVQPGCTVATPLACTFRRDPYVQFTSDTGGAACSVLPSNYQASGWNGITKVGYDGSMMYPLGGAADWLPDTSYVFPDSIIWPQANNGSPTKNAFQATLSGTSSDSSNHVGTCWNTPVGTSPNWAANAPTKGSTCTDGGVTWTNTGTILGQGSGFDLVSYIPSQGCSRLNTRIGKVYRGTGNSNPAGPVTTDDDLVCAEYGTSPCPLPDVVTIHDGGGEADGAHLMWVADVNTSCVVPGMCSCTNATNANYLGAWNAGTGYISANHDTVYDPNHTPHSLYAAVQNSTGVDPYTDSSHTYWTPGDAACDDYVWDVNTTIVRPCMSRGSGMYGDCDAHGVHGYINYFHGTAGISQLYSHLYSKPSVAGHANPGVGTLPSQGPPNGYHGTYLNMGTTDTAPYGLSNDGVPTSNYAIGPNGHTGPGNLPWYVEFTMQSLNLTPPCSPPGDCINGGTVMYRFNHMYNTGVNPNFNVQNNVSSVSPDGRFVAVTTDMMGTRGSISPDWVGSHAYTLGTFMFPTASSNTGNFDYQATVAGTSSGSEPNWSTCQTAGNTCSDGGVTWTNLGASCNQLRAFYQVAKSTLFSLGDTLYPLLSNSNANIFKVTQVGTTPTYTSLPNWNSAPNWGNTICDDAGHELNQSCFIGGVQYIQWTNLGANDCRGDVMAVDLLSAH